MENQINEIEKVNCLNKTCEGNELLGCLSIFIMVVLFVGLGVLIGKNSNEITTDKPITPTLKITTNPVTHNPDTTFIYKQN